jgi:hypothetical protein
MSNYIAKQTVVKNRPMGYGSSQGGIYAPVSYDPNNLKVSVPVSTQKLTGSGMRGKGIGAEIIGSMAGVAGGVGGAWVSGGNPYIVAGASTAVGGVAKSIAEMIGLGQKGGATIPQAYINFVDRLIRDGKTFSQIKSSIMNFELSPELKSKLSKAVSSLLRSMSGQGKKKMVRTKVMIGMGSDPMTIMRPNSSSYGLAKF